MVNAIVLEGGSDKLTDFLKIHAEHQVLKYAVSKQMFCPVGTCGKILDYRKAVLIEFDFGKEGTKTAVMCEDCFNSEPVQTQLEKHKQYIKEITKYRKA
jgi:hypothetical protein